MGKGDTAAFQPSSSSHRGGGWERVTQTFRRLSVVLTMNRWPVSPRLLPCRIWT